MLAEWLIRTQRAVAQMQRLAVVQMLMLVEQAAQRQKLAVVVGQMLTLVVVVDRMQM